MKINVLLCIIIYRINGLPLQTNIPNNQNKPDQNRDLFEGDIVLPKTRGILLRGNTVAWPNGVVPYEIAPGYAPESEQYIVATMAKMERLIAINNVKCVQFRPKVSTDQYYITIRNGYGCSSPVGQMTGYNGERTVTLQEDGCLDDGRVMHELIHTLGFFHEQSRPDRDNYIRINYENIISGLEYNFEKYDNSYVNTLNTSYDYASVMHYPGDAFSSNGLPTIEPLQANVTIGQHVGMSPIDIQEIRLFYNCSSTGQTFPPTPSTTTVNYYTVNTTKTSSLTTNSPSYNPYRGSDPYYYQVFQLTVPSYSYYRIFSNSLIDTFGYLYEDTFDPYTPYSNLIYWDDESGGNHQFLMKLYLQPNIRYLVVFTTYLPLVTGNYTLTVSGTARVNLTKININSTITTPVTTSTTTTSPLPIYSSALTINSPVFNRQKYIYYNFYYEAIAITVSTDGYYMFIDNSTVDSYGYLYFNDFNPEDITQNLLTQDDDSGGNVQFLITYYLFASYKYILVQTTYLPGMTTSFTITPLGPGSVSFTSETSASTTQMTRTTTLPRASTTRLATTATARPTTTTARLVTTASGPTATTARRTTTTVGPTITTTSRSTTTTTVRPVTTTIRPTITTSRVVTTTLRPTATTPRRII